jgi:membrane associated rhomboid family serine protease
MRENRGFTLNAVWFLIGVNIILFIATTLNSDIEWRLGLQAASFTEEPWKIVTNLFIHADILHILFNMITLFFFGTYLSTLIGDVKFLTIYFLGGLLGNAFFMLWALYAPWADPLDRYTTAIGASGAIFAVMGAMAVLRPQAKALMFFVVPLPLWAAVLFGFLVLSFIPDVAWQAHLGGLVLGLIAGFLLRNQQRTYL